MIKYIILQSTSPVLESESATKVVIKGVWLNCTIWKRPNKLTIDLFLFNPNFDALKSSKWYVKLFSIWLRVKKEYI